MGTHPAHPHTPTISLSPEIPIKELLSFVETEPMTRDTWQCCRSGQCQEGSTCVLDMQEQGTPGYTCVCPLGRKV